MPCTTDAFNCHIRNIYIWFGSSGYHGELCSGCPYWLDLPADIAFKSRSDILIMERNRERVSNLSRTDSRAL